MDLSWSFGWKFSLETLKELEKDCILWKSTFYEELKTLAKHLKPSNDLLIICYGRESKVLLFLNNKYKRLSVKNNTLVEENDTLDLGEEQLGEIFHGYSFGRQLDKIGFTMRFSRTFALPVGLFINAM